MGLVPGNRCSSAALTAAGWRRLAGHAQGGDGGGDHDADAPFHRVARDHRSRRATPPCAMPASRTSWQRRRRGRQWPRDACLGRGRRPARPRARAAGDAIRTLRDGQRRRPHRLHVGHDRRAEGLPPLSPRRDGDARGSPRRSSAFRRAIRHRHAPLAHFRTGRPALLPARRAQDRGPSGAGHTESLIEAIAPPAPRSTLRRPPSTARWRSPSGSIGSIPESLRASVSAGEALRMRPRTLADATGIGCWTALAPRN